MKIKMYETKNLLRYKLKLYSNTLNKFSKLCDLIYFLTKAWHIEITVHKFRDLEDNAS